MKEGKGKGLQGLGFFYLALMGVGFVALLTGLINIQYHNGELWRKKAASREESYKVQEARRGNIYSSDGQILATTVPMCDLYLDLGHTKKKDKRGRVMTDDQGRPIEEYNIADSNYNNYLDKVCEILCEATKGEKTAEWFRDRIDSEYRKEKSNRCYLIQRKIPYSSWMEICRLPGWNRIVVKKIGDDPVIRDERAHVYENLAANIIGFPNSRELHTYTGLEGYYDSVLRGQDGLMLCRRLTKGVWLPINDPRAQAVADSLRRDSSEVIRQAINGSDIISTIDTRYQDIAEHSLREALIKRGAVSGCAILMDMHTGYILACSNLTLDTGLHQFVELPNSNIAVSDRNEPGSTFKTVILAAMLEDPALHLDTAMRFEVPKRGSKDFPGKNGTITDDHIPFRDSLSVTEIIANSSNIGMCQLGWTFYRDRRDTLRHLVERIFPFKSLHVDLTAGELNGKINNLHSSNRDFLNFCYGYSDAVSPLQILTFYNAIGAGGRMVKPLFCKAIITNGDTHEIKPIVLQEQTVSRRTADILRDLLVGVVERGTGNNILNNAYGIAGKTGTAKSWLTHGKYNGSFAGFFPVDNPRYSCYVLLKESNAYGRNAAEVFQNIANSVMAFDKKMGNIEKQQGTLVNGHWVADTNQNLSTEFYMPYVRKGNQEELLRIYKRLGLPYLSNDSSSYWCAYVPGVDRLRTKAHYERYAAKKGEVPDCMGMSAKDAVAILKQSGYQVKISGMGKVYSQEPRPKTPCKEGSTIVIALKN